MILGVSKAEGMILWYPHDDDDDDDDMWWYHNIIDTKCIINTLLIQFFSVVCFLLGAKVMDSSPVFPYSVVWYPHIVLEICWRLS